MHITSLYNNSTFFLDCNVNEKQTKISVVVAIIYYTALCWALAAFFQFLDLLHIR
jgi:hypothetical protein